MLINYIYYPCLFKSNTVQHVSPIINSQGQPNLGKAEYNRIHILGRLKWSWGNNLFSSILWSLWFLRFETQIIRIAPHIRILRAFPGVCTTEWGPDWGIWRGDVQFVGNGTVDVSWVYCSEQWRTLWCMSGNSAQSKFLLGGGGGRMVDGVGVTEKDAWSGVMGGLGLLRNLSRNYLNGGG